MSTLKFNEFFPNISELKPNPINPYVEKVKEAYVNKALPLVLTEELKFNKGKWLNVINENFNTNGHFKKFEKLYLEIGSYRGQTLVEMALEHPDYFFIGMDITFKRVYLIAEKIKKYNLSNALCIMANARFIHEIFGTNELDGIIVFFPDPWPKKKHAKYRLFSSEFICSLYEILKNNGFVWIKTDNEEYFNQIDINMKKLNKFKEFDNTQNKQDKFYFKDYYSPFYNLFLKQNKIIYEKIWKKSN